MARAALVEVAQLDRDKARRRELADFLRSKRMRLKPADVGLSSGRRRLTPGLRREEVAELAGIGTSWYTWLEQARDIRPSERTLRNIARVLQLDQLEKEYFLKLALETAKRTPDDDVITPTMMSILKQIPTPAFILSSIWDVIAYNETANAIFDFDYMEPDRNFLRSMLKARGFHPNWQQVMRHQVGVFRAQHAGRLGDSRVAALVAELTAESDHFQRWWSEQVISETNSGHVTCDHPFVGRVSFEYESLSINESPGVTLRLLMCVGAESRHRVEELIRQLRHGDRSATHNLWTDGSSSLIAPRKSAGPGTE